MGNIKIAHLSDLHCDSSTQWKENFFHIVACLKNISPNLIVITGDCVDNPRKKHFESLVQAFSDLKEKLSDIDGLHIITVPGNHDYNWLGLKLFNLRKGLFQANLKELLYPGDTYEDVVVSFFNNFKIAIFPLDSNNYLMPFTMAQGKITSPICELEKFNRLFEKLTETKTVDYSICKKIVLLHHHPLPVPTPRNEEKLESFLVLRNAYQFLEAARVSDIDMILHGHKHMSSLANYTIWGNKKKTITISSCSSTGSLRTQSREIKLVEIKDSGSTSVYSYRASSDNSEFEIEREEGRETLYYGDIRKFNYSNMNLLSDKYNCPIVLVKNKTKIVEIKDDGSAIVNLAMTDIKWKPGIDPSEKKVVEHLRADLGRIAGGWYEFGSCSMIIEPQYQWNNPLLAKNNRRSPTDPEDFEVSFRPKNPTDSTAECCFRLEYPFFNGFTLTQREFHEIYNLPEKEPQEYATVSVNYPTYMLELIVRFPDDFFPYSDDIYLEATKKNPEADSLDLLRRNAELDVEETTFLKNKAAVRIRPEVNEIAAIIKYAQPHLEYSLRWDLPVGMRELELEDPRHIRGFDMLCKEMLKPESGLIEAFYQQILTIPEKEQLENLKVFLLGYNGSEKLLEVIKTPEEYENKETRKILVGRGPAGRAFRTREAIFWEKGVGLLDELKLPACQLENAVEGLTPIKVLAVPLLYPAFIDRETGKVIEQNDSPAIAPAFGVVSFVSESEVGLKIFSELIEKERGEIYTRLNLLFKEFTEKCFSSFL